MKYSPYTVRRTAWLTLRWPTCSGGCYDDAISIIAAPSNQRMIRGRDVFWCGSSIASVRGLLAVSYTIKQYQLQGSRLSSGQYVSSLLRQRRTNVFHMINVLALFRTFAPKQRFRIGTMASINVHHHRVLPCAQEAKRVIKTRTTFETCWVNTCCCSTLMNLTYDTPCRHQPHPASASRARG